MAMTGTGATITATAGEISILNVANVFDATSTVNVPTAASSIWPFRPTVRSEPPRSI